MLQGTGGAQRLMARSAGCSRWGGAPKDPKGGGAIRCCSGAVPANLPRAASRTQWGTNSGPPASSPSPPSVRLLPPPHPPPLPSAFSSSSSSPSLLSPPGSRDSSESRKWPRGRNAAADARSGPPPQPRYVRAAPRWEEGGAGGRGGALRRLPCPQGGVSPDRAVCIGNAGGGGWVAVGRKGCWPGFEVGGGGRLFCTRWLLARGGCMGCYWPRCCLPWCVVGGLSVIQREC